ncbi:hypothetical protein GX50_00544 [[Emmonsia] crescens]|uniref:Uncharacterized protein n=1 Tax=[Emmonsia] crescens TaxID=73230 RepID=A0A2B7ZUL6_9EURO|nr:hypothetical protein GX50_00544 [Emmonsia crescens]
MAYTYHPRLFHIVDDPQTFLENVSVVSRFKTSIMSANSLKFYFNVEFIQPNYEVQGEIRDSQSWHPPTHPNAVSSVATTGWRKWEAGSITHVQVADNPKFQECSLFYTSESDFFFGVPFNCRAKSVHQEITTRDERHGWRRLTFNHREPTTNGNHLSVLAFDGAHNVCAAQGSPKWMPELIPKTYNYNGPHANELGSTALAGNLALLIGLAAFSGPFPRHPLDVEQAVDAIRAFNPPNWVPHNLNTQKAHSQGVIVSIKSIGGNDRVLDAWAGGAFGPLIKP